MNIQPKLFEKTKKIRETRDATPAQQEVEKHMVANATASVQFAVD
jgi:hypothetical protein